MKLLLKLLILVGIAAYLVFAFIKFPATGSNVVCNAVRISIADSTQAGFITTDEVERILQRSGLYPKGKLIDSINNHLIEQALLKNTFIREAKCYKSANGCFNVLITRRLPLVRVLTEKDDYYVDADGNIMKAGQYKANIVVATGNIEKSDLPSLIGIGAFLANDPFWNNQVEQINVLPDKNIELVPRVGEQIIILGKATNLKKKFRNLKIFYERVMPEVGWNKYTALNLTYDNQVICKKHKAH